MTLLAGRVIVTGHHCRRESVFVDRVDINEVPLKHSAEHFSSPRDSKQMTKRIPIVVHLRIFPRYVIEQPFEFCLVLDRRNLFLFRISHLLIVESGIGRVTQTHKVQALAQPSYSAIHRVPEFVVHERICCRLVRARQRSKRRRYACRSRQISYQNPGSARIDRNSSSTTRDL